MLSLTEPFLSEMGSEEIGKQASKAGLSVGGLFCPSRMGPELLKEAS